MSTDSAGFTQLFGLMVHDPAAYAEYRAQMTPLLHRHGGDFGVDLEVARVLKPPAADDINRVFTITFPSRAAREAFFSNADYLAVRGRHFEGAVTRVLLLGEWGD